MEPFLPAGRSVNDFLQQIFVGSVELSRGHLVFHGEVLRSHHETPLREDGLTVHGGYGELSWRFAAGWNAAARYDLLRFEEVEVDGDTRSWDQDVTRWEVGLRYAINRRLQVKAVVQATDVGDGFTDQTVLPMLQTVVGF